MMQHLDIIVVKCMMDMAYGLLLILVVEYNISHRLHLNQAI